MVFVDHILVGQIAPLGARAAPSGIRKCPIGGAAHIHRLGIAGDAQGDLRVHGGPDKAVHHYALDHYSWWRDELGKLEALEHPGAFGENLSTRGLTEEGVAIGDVFRLGSATLQVSQARNPCWKLNARFGVPDVAARVIASGRGGWYYRVVEEGQAMPGDALDLVDRPSAMWTLTRAWAAMHGETPDRADLSALARLPTLASEWQRMAAIRLAKLG